jgi:hypothetical protein
VVKHPTTGDHRLLYCVEAPDSWFEDFGKATLAGGQASVQFDPDFAALVHTDDYHVFLTEYGGNSALYVDKTTVSGFTVRAASDAGGGMFSWRVVAKRADVKLGRLAKFEMPKAPQVDPATFPKAASASVAPKKP